jgi:formamidopyrimidine-DNA glycosylase
MPELPDITIYVEALAKRIQGKTLKSLTIRDPFVLRTFDPPSDVVVGKPVREIRRLGKRIAIGFDEQLWIVIHLMIAGRLQWRDAGTKPLGRASLATFTFATGTLHLTEAGTKHRASLHIVQGKRALLEHDPGGLEILEATLDEFRTALRKENHTLKRSLADPRTFSGIGNAYSDEILHRARLSPIALSQKLTDVEIDRLYHATRETLVLWTDRLRSENGDGFPAKVTAFRPEMAVHGRFGQNCPDCAAPIQRIRYADNETNYCPRCQTGGRILADRSLSRLLKDDWPRHLDDL